MTTPKTKPRGTSGKTKRTPSRSAPRAASDPAVPPDAEANASGSSEGPEKKAPGSQAKPRPGRRRKPPAPARSSSKASLLRTIAIAAACLVLLPVTVTGAFAVLPGAGDGKSVELDWPSKADSSEAARRLSAAGLVRSAWLSQIYFGLAGDVQAIEPGVHLLQDDMSPRTLLRRLLRLPGGTTVRVTIPEGYNKFDVARRLQEKGVCSSRAFLAQSADAGLVRELRIPGPDAEGYLFAATYDFARNAAPARVIRRMALEADKRYASVFDKHETSFAELRQTFGWTRHDVISLASVVEKEAAVDDERPIIASVFLNRLRDPKFRPEKRLQSDPTAVYGCLLRPESTPTCAHAERGATGPMVRDPLNAYSTYAHAGLPPGPIANPSVRSIEAVLKPATTKFYYFVATGNGRHTFSETYENHRNAIPPAP